MADIIALASLVVMASCVVYCLWALDNKLNDIEAMLNDVVTILMVKTNQYPNDGKEENDDQVHHNLN